MEETLKMSGAVNKRTLNTLTIERKTKVIEAVEAGTKRKKEIAAEFNIPVSTLSTILKNKDKIMSSVGKSVKRQREAEYPDIEKCTYKWFLSCRSQNIPISGPLIREKAVQFAKKLKHSNFAASVGWLGNFKKRHGISFKSICGESKDVNDETCELWKSNLHSIIESYSPKDVFNADETALFYKCLPQKTLTLKNEKCHGGKQSKERLTLLLAVNMDGSEKLLPLIIGKSKKPRCFSGIKTLPVEYTSNSRAWMTSDIFSNWLAKLNRKMSREKRKILMIIDNCPAHSHIPTLSSIQIQFLPPNTTSKLQPLDLGIIQNFKVFYRTEIIKKMLAELDETNSYENINILDAMRFADKAWRKIEKQTIVNCFGKAGFSSTSGPFIASDSEQAHAEMVLWTTLSDKLQIPDEATFQDFASVDSEALTCMQPTDQAIIEECLEKTNETDDGGDEIDEPKNLVSLKDAKNAFETLRLFVEQTEGVESEIFSALHSIERVIDLRNPLLVQKKLTDFFQ